MGILSGSSRPEKKELAISAKEANYQARRERLIRELLSTTEADTNTLLRSQLKRSQDNVDFLLSRINYRDKDNAVIREIAQSYLTRVADIKQRLGLPPREQLPPVTCAIEMIACFEKYSNPQLFKVENAEINESISYYEARRTLNLKIIVSFLGHENAILASSLYDIGKIVCNIGASRNDKLLRILSDCYRRMSNSQKADCHAD